MRETFNSVGIDIGTTTTQLVFSALTVENQAAGAMIPKIGIVEKKIVYESGVYFTPLLAGGRIDIPALEEIMRKEYMKAGFQPSDLKTGAVIITGETARMENAKEVLRRLSGMAGDFVVSAAGPALEAVLAAKGAGTDSLSREIGEVTANVDIGGGTSNIAVFQKGVLLGTACLDIGGRLLKVKDNRITEISPRLQKLLNRKNLPIRVGGGVEDLPGLCALLAEHIARALRPGHSDEEHLSLYTNAGQPLDGLPAIRAVTYSGGVGACLYEDEGETFRYGDIGVLLARAVREQPMLRELSIWKSRETLRATVVGAGMHTTLISGSTIRYAPGVLPLKNLPVVRLEEEEEADAEKAAAALSKRLRLYCGDNLNQNAAIALSGRSTGTFQKIQRLAETILRSSDQAGSRNGLLVVILEADIGKALGNALKVKSGGQREVVCIDGVYAGDGDYVDIGTPLADGAVAPVVVKSLLFNARE